MAEMPTQPGWTPPPARRRGLSDRVILALISAGVAIFFRLAEAGVRQLAPDAQAAPDVEVARRVEKIEAGMGEFQKSLNAVVVDVAVLKAERKK